VEAEPANVYTGIGTVLVDGMAASCYVVSEWWGWADMLPTRLFGCIAPSLLRHPLYDRVRRSFDKFVDPWLYRFGALRSRAWRSSLPFRAPSQAKPLHMLRWPSEEEKHLDMRCDGSRLCHWPPLAATHWT
jgi:hypothetical protein